MVAIKVFYGSECRRAKSAPEDLQGLKTYISTIIGTTQVVIKYKDEDGDLITICTENEYQDFLSSCTTLATIYLEPNSSFSSTTDLYSSLQISQPILTNSTSIESISKNQSELNRSPKNQSFTNPILLSSIRNILKTEFLNSVPIHQSSTEHPNTICFMCKMTPIVGIRYKCSECNIDLCEICERDSEHEHPFFKIREPETIEVVPNDSEYKSKALHVVREKIAEFKQQERAYFESNMKSLLEMGFSRESAKQALEKTNNSIEYALNYLTSMRVNK